jgi:hypothetical protein
MIVCRPSSWSTRQRIGIAVLMAIGVVYILSRSLGLDQSFWEDEMYTANHYVNQGWKVVFDPESYRQNNHPLFSLIGSLLLGVFGKSEVLLRLGSVVPAFIAAIMIGYWVWTRYGRVAGAAFALFITLSPMHFEEFRQARGWGLAVLGTTIVLVSSLEMHRCDRIRWFHITWFVTGALIGIWSIYAVALPMAVHGAILLVARRERWRLAGGGFLVLLGTVLFYWPLRNIISDPASLRSRGGESGSIRDGFVTLENVVTEPFDRLVTPLFELALPHGVALLVSVSLVLGGATLLWRTRHWASLLHLFLPMMVVFFGLAVRESGIWDRYVSFLLPHALVLTALGISMLWSISSRLSPLVPAGIFTLLAIGMLVGFWRFAVPIVSVPQENFKGAAALIEAGAPLKAAFTHTVVSEFNYNLESVELEEIPRDEFFDRSCTQEGPAVFVDYPRRLPPADTRCLEQRGFQVVLPQRQSPPISVWLIP